MAEQRRRWYSILYVQVLVAIAIGVGIGGDRKSVV